MKHGPIALIDEKMPVVVIATKKGHYQKVMNNIEEIKSRKGKIIGVVTEGDNGVIEIETYMIEVPDTIVAFTPLLTQRLWQSLYYHMVLMRGTNVDQPRNVAR